MTNPPLFSSITVSWNSSDCLRGCIESLRTASDRAKVPIEIIVIDNASLDHSAELARKSGADLVISNPINAGFAVAASQGVSRAQCPWIMMVNPDLIVAEDFVVSMASAVRAVPDHIACFAPELRFSADKTRINSRGIAVDTLGVPAEIDKGQPADATSFSKPVFAGSGGGALLRRSALEHIGAFEPLYFAYYEDVDLGWRLQRSGYQGRFLPSAHACHDGSSTTGVASPLQTYLVARNRRLLFYRHGPHNWRARTLRMIVDSGHAVASSALTRSAMPLIGRAAALRQRKYLNFLKRRDLEKLHSTALDLTPPPSLRGALIRKLRSLTLEQRSK